MTYIIIDSSKGLLLLFLAILANFLGNTMNCGTQKLLTESPLFRNIAVYFLIYFTINFTSSNISPSKLFMNSGFVFVLFILLMKQNKILFVINLFIIFMIFVSNQSKMYYENKKSKKDVDHYHLRTKFFAETIPFTLILGFILYFVKQYSDYGTDFNILKFLFGTNVCDSMK